MKFINFSIDDYIADILTQNDFFKHIHPNAITLVGVIFNIIIFRIVFNNKFNLLNNKYDNIAFFIILLTRYLSDILDGKVARKYNKVSELGNYLDSLSDIMMCFIIYSFIIKIYTNTSNKLIILSYIFILFIFQYTFNIFNTHSLIKNNINNNIFTTIISVITNNTIIMFSVFYIIYTRK